MEEHDAVKGDLVAEVRKMKNETGPGMVILGSGSIVCAARAVERNSVEIDALLRATVGQERVPMAVARVADARGVVYEGAAGVKSDAIYACCAELEAKLKE